MVELCSGSISGFGLKKFSLRYFLNVGTECSIIVGSSERMKTYKFINLPPRELKPWVIARADDKWMEDLTSDLNNQLQDGWELFQVVYAGNRFIAVLTK